MGSDRPHIEAPPTPQLNSLLSGSATYLFSNVVNAAIPFALLPILTRYLSPGEYGQVAMFQTLLGALGAFVGMSLVGATGRKYYDGHITQGELAYFNGACLQIVLASSCFVLAILFLFRVELAAWLNLQIPWVLLAVVMATAAVLVQLRLGQWQIRKKPLSFGAMQISQSAFNMALSLLLVVVLLQGASGRIAAQILTAGVFALISLIIFKRDGLLSFWSWRPDYIKEALSFGMPLIPHLAGGFLLSSLDRLVINAELGVSDAGIYMVAAQLVMAMGLIFDALNNAYVPWLFERLKRNLPDEKRKIVRYTYVWFLVILSGVALAFAVGPWLVAWIAGPRYARAGDVIGWLALGQGFTGMYLMVTNYIFYSKRTGLLSLVTISCGLLNLLLLVIFIRLFGLVGAAIAYSIATALRFLLTWLVASKRHSMPWFQLNTQIRQC